MTDFRLRTRIDQPSGDGGVILLDWLANRAGSNIQVRHSLTKGLALPTSAIEFLRFAAAVYCADRLAIRGGEWTRSIRLDFPVADSTLWSPVVDDLSAALRFLSGDTWDLRIFDSNEASQRPARPVTNRVDAVCLFSGGLDSLAGAIDLLADGRKVCLVAHYEGGQASRTQVRLARRLMQRYGRDKVVLRRLFLRPAPPSSLQQRQLPNGRESSTRSRSLLFLAAGLAVASGYGPEIALTIPENGFIGINVPLTRARSGSLTTRTTHPHFMKKLGGCVEALGLLNPIHNPYRLMTKGEVLAASKDKECLFGLAKESLSCAHPEAARYAKRVQGNCGYCFPCLIRRAAMAHVKLDAGADYSFDALRELVPLEKDRGADRRALLRALNTPSSPIDVLRNGPVPSDEIGAFADVHARGRNEILRWMREGKMPPELRRLLPTT